MRRLISLGLVICTSVALADEGSSGAAGSGQASSAQGSTAARRPLHRHPTLLGMLRRNNDVRRRLGLRPHRLNPALTKAAQDQANYMAQTAQFSHYVNGGPQYRAGKYGFRGGVLENIAYGSRSVDSTFAMWVGSSGHYASIVSNTSDAGFGYAISPSGQCYWVGVYANRASGDAVGETEEEIAKAAQAEEEALAEAETTKDSSVTTASATEGVEDSAPPAESAE
ncbi:MAG TPA: CAP domain-containing protein [Pirellulaceae bacterium]|nr:CAP domain-containing protein [Pirellulaceae bacterium]